MEGLEGFINEKSDARFDKGWKGFAFLDFKGFNGTWRLWWGVCSIYSTFGQLHN